MLELFQLKWEKTYFLTSFGQFLFSIILAVVSMNHFLAINHGT